jgi:hypothetical protein
VSNAIEGKLMTAMIRKPILMPDDLIEMVETIADAKGVPFAEAARDLMRRGVTLPVEGTSNPFGLDDEVLEGMLDLALESAEHSIAEVDGLLATLEARETARVQEP